MAGLDRITKRRMDGTTHAVLLLLAAVGDAVNFASALGLAMQDQPTYVLWSAVAALTASAVGLMHFAGISVKQHAGTGSWRSAFPGSAITLTAIWVILGLSLLFLRTIGETPTAVSTTTAGFGVEASAAGPADTTPHLALALMFFALYLATGAMAAWSGYGRHQPEQLALRRAERLRARAVREHQRADARVIALRADIGQLVEERARDQERYAAAVTGCDAWAEELRQHARVRMAVVVGDPAGTSALT